jgi:predicted RNase H-like HicB family nuclease
MQLTVLVERLNEQTYRAETAQPVPLATEGRTREEAVERLRELVHQRLAAGEMIQLDVPEVAGPHPWLPFAGIWKDHPDIDALLDNIADNRRCLDEAESEV